MTEKFNTKIPTKLIFRNSIIAVIQVVLSTLIMFILYSYLLREMGPEKLGTWSILMSAANSLRMGELGLSGSVVKYVAKYRAKNDLESASLLIQTGFVSLAVFIFFVLVILYPLLSWIFKFVFPISSLELARSLLPFALIYLWISILGGVFQAGLDGCIRTDLRSIVILIGNLIVLGFSVILVPLFGISGLLISQIIQSLALIILGWILLRKVLPVLPILTIHWRKAYFKEMINYGYKVQIIGLISIITDPVIKMLIGKFGGLDFAGYFDMALRLVHQIRSLLLAANQTLVPYIAHLFESTNDKIKEVFQINFNLLAYFSLPIYFSLSFLAPLISELWIGNYNQLFVLSLIIITFGEAFHILAGPAYFIYLGVGNLNWNVLSNIFGLISCFTFSAILGNFIGGIGIVIGFSLSLVIKGLMIIIPYKIENKIPTHSLFPSENLRVGFFGLIITICNLAFYYLCTSKDTIGLKFLSGIISFGLILLLMWFHPLREKIISAIKQKMDNYYAS